MESPRLASRRYWTIPNALSLFRLVGSLSLIPLAILGWQTAFLGMVIAVIVSDWIDGKLAILLNQRSAFGARLDSLADATMYGAILLGMLWLRSSVVLQESPWIGAAVVSYAVMGFLAWWKFGVWPSYHTRAAKTCWLLTSIAVVATLADGSPWFLRAAMGAVVLANLEMMLITAILSRPATDVSSVFHVWRHQRARTTDDRQIPVAN